MARLIVKSPYIKCGGGKSAGGYLKYIATRERVEIIPDDRPPTNKQEQLIAKLVEDFPDAKELMEYEDYLSHPTKATASALITLTLESNWDRLSSMDGYAKYIALRPRAERLGEHGLFGDDDAVDLAAVADELDHYTGNVWTHIISLHREDAERLGYLDAADRRGLLPMFYLELVTGLRKGEITALLWSDLDIQNKTISVSKQYVKNPNGELTLSRPKTETSVRKISIPQDAIDLLIAEHSKHPENPYMFPSPATGEMYYPDSVVNLHKKILKDAGLPHIRFHDLRHTFATLALQNGVDVKTVSSMLGHYDAGFTLRTYTHATRQKQDEAAQTMGNFMAQVM